VRKNLRDRNGVVSSYEGFHRRRRNVNNHERLQVNKGTKSREGGGQSSGSRKSFAGGSMLHFAAINNISKTIRSAVSQRVSKRKKKRGGSKRERKRRVQSKNNWNIPLRRHLRVDVRHGDLE